MNGQGLDSYDQVRLWEKANIGMNLYNLPKEIRPCISQLLVTSLEEGNGRSKSGLYIAVELRKYDITEEKIEKVLNHWNLSNMPPLNDKEIRGILKQSDKKDLKGSFKYSPGCNKDLQDFCVGKDSCNYYIKNFKGKSSIEPNYLGMGWQHVLTSREREVLFYVLPKIEKIRKLKKGSPIVITVRQLNYHTGIDQRYFNEILTNLKDYGLLDYKPGLPQVWKHKATEIRRIIPAPEIAKRYRKAEAYKEFKQDMKARLSKKTVEFNMLKCQQ